MVTPFCASTENESMSSNSETDKIVEQIKKKLKPQETMIKKRRKKKQQVFI